MTKLTISGLIDFVCSQDPAKPVNDSRWTTCAVGEYAKSQEVVVEWGPLVVDRFTEFQSFVCEELMDERSCWSIFTAKFEGSGTAKKERTYGDLQQNLIAVGLVAKPGGD